MPVSISICDLGHELDTEDLLNEIKTAVQQKAPQFADLVEYHVRDDEKIAVSVPGARGLLEIELDDSTMVHIHSSFVGKLEKLQISLAVLDHLIERHGGDYEKDEISLLRKLTS